MNIDQEFFSIVERLGPMGELTLATYEPHPAAGTYAHPSSDGCGCGNEEEGACCSTGQQNQGLKVGTSFPGLTPGGVESRPGTAPGRAAAGPADRRITPFPKWDPATRAWWVWDESAGAWTKAA